MWADNLAFAIELGVVDNFAAITADERFLLILKSDMLAGAIVDLNEVPLV